MTKNNDTRLLNVKVSYIKNSSLEFKTLIVHIGQLVKEVILDKNWTVTKVFKNMNYGKRGGRDCAKIILSYTKKTH